MAGPIFDSALRRMRRDRAATLGAATFLHERAFADCLERLGDIRRSFTDALLLGCPDPAWPERLRAIAGEVTAADPGARFARAAGGLPVDDRRLDLGRSRFDLCLAVGTLDTLDDLPAALAALRDCLRPGALLMGAMAGGQTLPALRSAMREADRAAGRGAAPHVHPRIDPASLGPLLAGCGFVMPVVDVDPVRVAYRSLDHLVRDLRAMAATSLLVERPRHPLGRQALEEARRAFAALGDGRATIERFDILHFAAWTPPAAPREPGSTD